MKHICGTRGHGRTKCKNCREVLSSYRYQLRALTAGLGSLRFDWPEVADELDRAIEILVALEEEYAA